MTNLVQAKGTTLISRERLLVGGPLLLGVLVAAACGWFLLRPAMQRIQILEQRRDELEQLQSSLPLLDQRIKTSLDALRLAQQQQAVLVSLLAGSGSVQTFLALLDQQAQESGVEIRRYEPLAEATQAPVQASRSGREADDPSAEKSQDPLMALGYHQSAVALQVVGPFPALQKFMRRMESLQLLVISSDLALEAESPQTSEEDQQPELLTDLSLKLSFYDLKSESTLEDVELQPEQAPS